MLGPSLPESDNASRLIEFILTLAQRVVSPDAPEDILHDRPCTGRTGHLGSAELKTTNRECSAHNLQERELGPDNP